MSERGAALAAEFERTNREMIEAVEQFSAEQWRTLVPGENWAVGVVAHHIAASHEMLAGWVAALAHGGELRPTPDQSDDINAEHARAYAACTQQQTIDLLRRNGEQAAQQVRGLDDQQLDRVGSFRGQPITAGEMIERILTGHPQRHLAHIRAALVSDLAK